MATRESDESELILTADAAERSGLKPRTLEARIRRAGVVLYQDGRDRRMRLIAVDDLERLIEARPVQRRTIEPETT